MIKLFEQAVCDRYYAAHGELLEEFARPIDEQLCKIPAIQNELAGLVGWKFTFDALPGELSERIAIGFGLTIRTRAFDGVILRIDRR